MTTAEPITPPPATQRQDPRPRVWSPTEFARICELGIFAGRAVALADGQLIESLDGESEPFTVKITQTEFCQLWDANFFRDQRVQLIGGEILQESPMNAPHATGIRKATRVLEKVFPTGHDVQIQLPLDFTPHSRPHPDVAVVVGTWEDYTERHPTTAVLVVEVSDSTIGEDTSTKMSLYAAAGIADYWVIDVAGCRVLVFRNPKAEAGQPFGHAYSQVSAFSRDQFIIPLAAPDVRVAVADLLP